MHDSSTFRSLMRRIDGLANAHGARRVTAVRVKLGALSHLSPEHFREHFEEAASDLAKDAAVEAEQTPDLFDVFLVDVELEI